MFGDFDSFLVYQNVERHKQQVKVFPPVLAVVFDRPRITEGNIT